jgi:hypothetical protein
MSEEPKQGEPAEESAIDPGEPVKELACFEYEASPAFLTVVRRKIHRRSAVSQLASFSWDVPKALLTELWNALVQAVGPASGKKERQS